MAESGACAKSTTGQPHHGSGEAYPRGVDDVLVRGLLQVIGISLVPVALVAAALRSGEVWRWWRRRRTRRHVAEPPSPQVPLERLAADLRRLHPQVHSPRRGTAMAKHRAAVLAYDQRLTAAAEALGIGTTLTELRLWGVDREAERLRLEHLLSEAGLRLRPSHPQGPAA